MILIAILVPGLSFLLRGKIFSALIAIVLQIIAIIASLAAGLGLFLWLALAVWAVMSYNNQKSDERINKLKGKL